MSSIFQPELALLSLRRTANAASLAWFALVLAAVLFLPAEEPAFGASSAVHDGFARQRVWTFFLLAVAPVLALGTGQRVAPCRSEDDAWLAPRAVTNGRIAVANWVGSTAAWCAAIVVFACASELGTTAREPLPELCGAVSAPTARWVATDKPLSWSVPVPNAERELTARLELGLGAGAGSAGEVRFSAHGKGDEERHTSITRIGNRGTIEVALPRGASEIEFELACSGEGRRMLVLSPATELWMPAHSRFAAGVAIALRLALAGAVWSALVLAAAAFVSGTTAAATVLALWIPVWLADGSPYLWRWIPAADLFDALEIVSRARVPALPTIESALGAATVIATALVATTLGLRRWRASR